jgi:hypothetical protein
MSREFVVRGIYRSREAALKAGANWYGCTIGYTPQKETKKVTITNLLNPNDSSIVLGEVHKGKDGYTLWLPPCSALIKSIRAGDKVEIAGKGWGQAVLRNDRENVWVCTHGIASDTNVKAFRKAKV